MASGNGGNGTAGDLRLTSRDMARFVRDGFVWVGASFSSKVAAEARAILWVATGCDPDDSTTWTTIETPWPATDLGVTPFVVSGDAEGSRFFRIRRLR